MQKPIRIHFGFVQDLDVNKEKDLWQGSITFSSRFLWDLYVLILSDIRYTSVEELTKKKEKDPLENSYISQIASFI